MGCVSRLGTCSRLHRRFRARQRTAEVHAVLFGIVARANELALLYPLHERARTTSSEISDRVRSRRSTPSAVRRAVVKVAGVGRRVVDVPRQFRLDTSIPVAPISTP